MLKIMEQPPPSRYSLSETVTMAVPGSGSMSAYYTRPEHGAVRGSVIVGMELFGVTAHVRDICDRLAAHGYAAVAPDFYHRTEPGTELPADDRGRERGFTLLRQLTRPQALHDLGATIDWLTRQPAPVAGMVGLSLGGHLAYLAAAHFELPATAVFYGGWIPTTDISISRPEPTIAATARITGRIEMYVGAQDPVVPAEHRRRIADALVAAGVEHRLIVYPGVGHGFLCDRRATFRPEAADDAWSRLLRLLGRN